jgi:hypothetical protein
MSGEYFKNSVITKSLTKLKELATEAYGDKQPVSKLLIAGLTTTALI